MEKNQTMRQKQAQISKEKIQRIIHDMSGEKTLDEIRIKDICDVAGMSVGNFYLYFPSKESALIYSYKTKDDYWATLGLEDIKDPLKRLCQIITTHLYSMIANSLCFDTQLYISQLKVYEEYFFTRERFLHKTTADAIQECQEKGLMNEKHSAYDTAIRLLNFSRGLVYNYCIAHVEEHEKWIKYAIENQQEYIQLFLTEKGKEKMESEIDDLWQPKGQSDTP
ncbi:MAG: TetR/AcrR family transcriptional regulator [Oribacterium sp.]|nr:TetR/AcrR family transcriptional regulator [Oribacterium sp.]